MLEDFLAILWTIFSGGLLTICALIFLATIIGIFAHSITWARLVALGFDFFWNVMTGGQLGVTISSRAEIARHNGKKWGRVLSSGLDQLKPNHCEKAIHNDIDRAKAVIDALAPYDTRN
jgi:hypothetical protein